MIPGGNDDPAYHRELRGGPTYDDLAQAVNDLLNTATPIGRSPLGVSLVSAYHVHPSYLTTLSRIVRDGLTYEEATNG